MRRIAVAVIMTLAILEVSPAFAKGADYDIIIENGRVMDPETNRDEVANVAIKGGKIVAISKERLAGRKSVDARGLVVSPGFIDLHVHIVDDTSIDYRVLDGTTSAFELELGAYPLKPYYDIRARHARMNYGASVGYGAARLLAQGAGAKDDTDGKVGTLSVNKDFEALARLELTEEQGASLLEYVHQGLAEGGLGVGIGLEYQQGANQSEILQLFYDIAPWQAPVFVHTREFSSVHTGEMLGGMLEVMADAAITSTPLHIVHVSSKGLTDTPMILKAIGSLRDRGVDVTVEVPAYAGATGRIGSALFDPGWTERWSSDYSDLEDPSTGERLTRETFDAFRAKDPNMDVWKHITPESAVVAGMSDPGVMIASDATKIEEGRSGNPRASGTNARTLGLYVRQEKLMSLMDAVRKMTIMPARRLEGVAPVMRSKGRLQVGADADLTIFDPETVIDNGNVRDPTITPTGIPYVIVGGQIVVSESKLVPGAFPGKAVYGSTHRAINPGSQPE